MKIQKKCAPETPLLTNQQFVERLSPGTVFKSTRVGGGTYMRTSSGDVNLDSGRTRSVSDLDYAPSVFVVLPNAVVVTNE